MAVHITEITEYIRKGNIQQLADTGIVPGKYTRVPTPTGEDATEYASDQGRVAIHTTDPIRVSAGPAANNAGDGEYQAANTTKYYGISAAETHRNAAHKPMFTIRRATP